MQFAKQKKIIEKDFPAGSSVMVIDPTRSTSMQPYYGPFTVLRRSRGGSYLLLDSDNTLLRREVTANQLKLISKDKKDDPLSFVVDKIINHRGPASNRQDLVRWQGYGSDEDSWEPFVNFNDHTCIRAYWSARQALSQPDATITTTTVDTPATQINLPLGSGPITRAAASRQLLINPASNLKGGNVVPRQLTPKP